MQTEVATEEPVYQPLDLQLVTESGESQSIADQLRSAAEQAISQSDYVLDEQSGLYYDQQTGYYYNPVSLWSAPMYPSGYRLV